ncbi:uncharacterized protein T551_00960 [Pneumocystis jirovecii RU7]|uniref:ubiquitinyl hydrolase 1 n=1 Tax=Pneumocystis jirovecii (strain RU7) TaxID=1408657 RepID=A0A0W4ZTN6_PNEJ7|nr:uncharacterized protein T551_00960 [Pneumocystis jirovecii RU7]KTW31699.1 hypothetical protein T551_00960 [Pneumocystis jirovecii RU7]
MRRKKKNISKHSFYACNDAQLLVYDTGVLELQVAEVISQLETYGYCLDYLTALKVLKGNYARGDVKRAVEFLLYMREASELVVHQIDPTIKLLGSENLNGVTCYLDALLFAMFAKTNCFEAMLFQEGKDSISSKLCTFIRLWVNMLRDGKLITSDIISQVCDALSECGWENASKVQQDACEVYTLITEQLDFPLLTFKVIIAHGGKFNSENDHKYIHERLLCVPIPGDFLSYETPISLEDCLSEYFSNHIKVRRYVERSLSGRSTKKNIQCFYGSGLIDNKNNIQECNDQLDDFFYNDIIALHSESDAPLVSAWQFFQLLPFYSDKKPDNLSQYFVERLPIVTICLKRYLWTMEGEAYCNSRKVLIPLTLELPYLISHEETSTSDPLEVKKYRLVLQSVVCHRNTGFTISSGHYIALSRDIHSKKWFLFDDLAYQKVSVFYDPDKVLNSEMPYMLFYQLESYVPTIPQKVPEIEFLKPINNTSNLLPFCNPLNNSFNIMKGFKKNCLIQ